MRNLSRSLCVLTVIWSLWSAQALAQTAIRPAGQLRAGAVAVDVTPTQAESIVAGQFLEVRSSTITDRLYARAIVLANGQAEMALVVVDTCMMPTDLIAKARQLAHQKCGIPVEHITISATHTHSAPAAMGCLGTRLDSQYAALLPIKIADAICDAHSRLQPARIGWSSIDDWEHTHNRRWIRKPEAMIVDPFGKATGRAHMHPGYRSRDVIGPSGPVDPELSLVSVQSRDGKPLALLANYSQHYFGSKPISADYFGLFAKDMAERLGQSGDGNGPFVCAMSQGTSGDLMWMDYGSPAKQFTTQAYAAAVADYASKALQKIEYQDRVELGVVEKSLTLDYRVPDTARLAWAKPIAEKIVDDQPKSLPEVYAREALILHERQSTTIHLQALRIGDLTIATLPNEVYALTGLKLKARSPGKSHFNIELAGGAEGYIPPPEQHALGGYTTWPARTAGLEVNAEPKIVETLLTALEEVTGKPRSLARDQHGPYAQALIEQRPVAYWRMNEADGRVANSAVPSDYQARLEGGFAWYLPGVGSGTGTGAGEYLKPTAFSGSNQINRSVHLADGKLSIDKAVGNEFTLSFWFWLGEASGASPRRGCLCQLPSGAKLMAVQDQEHRLQLKWQLSDEQANDPPATSKKDATTAADGLGRPSYGWADDWHNVTIIAGAEQCRVVFDGRISDATNNLTADLIMPVSQAKGSGTIALGEGLQGKLDEIALFDRALENYTVRSLWQLSDIELDHKRAVFARQRSIATPKPQGASPGSPTDTSHGPASEPLSPEDSLAALHVARGFRAELMAAEPIVLDPVAFDWDIRGRLWVVEMADYPLGMDGKGKPGGRVRILQDRDGDGRYDESKLFADGLNFPNGIMTWRDGVLITAAPQILYLRDTDGDDKADQTEILFEGFQQGNQQLRLNGLRYGLDNWVYCANGGHHANYGIGTKVTSRKLGQSFEIGSRDFRIQPDTGQLALESGPSQYGRNRDAWGHWFGVQNAKPLWHYVIPDRYLARNPHVPAAAPIHFVLPAGSPPVYPASLPEKRYHSFNEAGHFTSACSGMIYNDRVLFGATDRLHAFTCEPFHNLIQHNVLADEGVTFIASRPVGEGKFDFFASEDRWSRPVMVRTGPDGALWVADMYRYMIEHPDWLPPAGKEDLLPHYRLGDDKGRIYRIVPDNLASRRPWAFPDTKVTTLVAAMDSTNDWQRDKAQQQLLWNVDKAAIPLLLKLSIKSPIAEARGQALATLSAMGALDPERLGDARHDASARVIELVIKLSEEQPSEAIVPALTALTKVADNKVCLQLALTLGQFEDRQAGEALVRLARRFPNDPFLRSAIMSSALVHARTFAAGLATSAPEVQNAFREPLLRQAIGAGDVELIALMFDKAISSDMPPNCESLDGLLLVLERLGTSLEKLESIDQAKLLTAQRVRVLAMAEQLGAIMGDTNRPIADRMAAARTLSRLEKYRAAAIEQLASALSPNVDPEVQQRALQALGQSADASVPVQLAKAWSTLTPALRAQALDVWTARATSTADLLERIEKGEIKPGSLDLTQRTFLMRYPNAKLAERAKAVFGQIDASSKRQTVLDQYQAALSLAANPERGQQVYKRACANCHRRGNSGNEVGPNLATVINHPKEKLLRNILDPNADIQPGYQAYTCLLDSGEILSGLLAGETSISLSIKAAGGELRTITRAEIEKLQNLNVSFMPEGLEANITPQEMADLLAYLVGPIEK